MPVEIGMRTLDRGLLYVRTMRQLRWEQLVFRAVRRIQARLPVRLPAHGATFDPRAAERLEPVVTSWGPEDASVVVRRADEVVNGVFRFLNRTERLDGVDWRRRYVSHLWSYNLHYFDYAIALAWAYRLTNDGRYARRLAQLLDSWIEGTVPGRGDGWEPYPTSLRVVNWIYALLLVGDRLEPSLRARVEASVYGQVAYLARRLEHHILANHLQKNYKALVVAGLVFGDARGRRWLRSGERGLWRELFEQVLPDGVQYERSPMYHAIALGDYLEAVMLLRAGGSSVPDEAVERIRSMVHALSVLSRPDGSLHLFNDAAQGIAPSPARLSSLSRLALGESIPRPEGAVALPEAGYFGWIGPEGGDRILIDCGDPGPRYQPGHAHCDLLSFELDLGGRPVVVDSGTSGYDGDPLREYVRSTRAHNTVEIGGREQSELWGTFRMARRAVVQYARQSASANEYRFTGAYTPFYSRRVAHHRVVTRRGGDWMVEDRVEGAGQGRLRGFLHLHPDFRIERADVEGIVARSDDGTVTIEPFGVDEVVVRKGEHDPIQGWYCPEFGKALPAPVIELVVRENDGRNFGYVIRRN